ncbi:MAG: hypothetical protein U9Q90_07905 [Campylobacterota bacterium]|nr:hypothetical protein [Campylobacterota bacterium]
MRNETIDRYNKIAKDCFWEYHFSAEEIRQLFKSDDQREKQFLFEKILLNSRELFKDMELFDRQDLEMMLENYIVPGFNKEYIYRRKNSVEYYFLDKPLMIDELKWTA